MKNISVYKRYSAYIQQKPKAKIKSFDRKQTSQKTKKTKNMKNDPLNDGS